MTDADLNALFAEKVAGWKMETVYNGVDGTSQKRLVKPGDIHANVRDENFTASMDAVAPWMEKFSHQNGEDNGGEPIVFRIYSPACADDVWTVEPVWMHHDGDIPETPVKDKSLPRACVLALLRAKGVGV